MTKNRENSNLDARLLYSNTILFVFYEPAQTEKLFRWMTMIYEKQSPTAL